MKTPLLLVVVFRLPTNQINLGHTDETVRISSAYTLPLADGSANQALVTNGSGALSFSAIGTTTTTAGESATTRRKLFQELLQYFRK